MNEKSELYLIIFLCSDAAAVNGNGADDSLPESEYLGDRTINRCREG